MKKNYMLAIATMVMLFICYELAFKKTISAWQEHKRLKEDLERGDDLSVQPGYLVRKKTNIAQILARYKSDTSNFRMRVINEISLVADREQVKLVEVPSEDPLFHTSKSIIQKLILQGDYFSLLRTLNKIEKLQGIGILRSVSLKMPERKQLGTSEQPLMELYLLSAK